MAIMKSTTDFWAYSIIASMKDEEWKDVPIPPFEYQVSSLGRIRRIHIMKPVTLQRYLQVKIGKKRYYVHRLVATAFDGSQPKNSVARHLNGNSLDNVADNVKWGTFKQNKSDEVIHGTRIRGEKHPKANLTELEVLEIRRLINNGVQNPELCKRFKTSYAAVYAIEHGKSWKHLLQPMNIQ